MKGVEDVQFSFTQKKKQQIGFTWMETGTVGPNTGHHTTGRMVRRVEGRLNLDDNTEDQSARNISVLTVIMVNPRSNTTPGLLSEQRGQQKVSSGGISNLPSKKRETKPLSLTS